MAGLRRLVNDVIDDSLASLPTAVAEHLTNSNEDPLTPSLGGLDHRGDGGKRPGPPSWTETRR